MKSQTDVSLQIMQSLSQLSQGDQTRDTDGGGCPQTCGHIPVKQVATQVGCKGCVVADPFIQSHCSIMGLNSITPLYIQARIFQLRILHVNQYFSGTEAQPVQENKNSKTNYALTRSFQKKKKKSTQATGSVFKGVGSYGGSIFCPDSHCIIYYLVFTSPWLLIIILLHHPAVTGSREHCVTRDTGTKQ